MATGLLDRLRDWAAPADARERTVDASVDFARAVEPTGRRDRAPTPAERQLAEAVGQKLLHGWLQNRHQTLMPLSVNLARLAPEDRARVARFAAVAATAGDAPADAAGDVPADGAAAPARLASWLAGAGADAETLALYQAALAAPPALGRAMADMAAPERAGIAYVLALVAAREGESGDAGHAFAAYVAKRLALPSAALRSAQRRYGR